MFSTKKEKKMNAMNSCRNTIYPSVNKINTIQRNALKTLSIPNEMKTAVTNGNRLNIKLNHSGTRILADKIELKISMEKSGKKNTIK